MECLRNNVASSSSSSSSSIPQVTRELQDCTFFGVQTLPFSETDLLSPSESQLNSSTSLVTGLKLISHHYEPVIQLKRENNKIEFSIDMWDEFTSCFEDIFAWFNKDSNLLSGLKIHCHDVNFEYTFQNGAKIVKIITKKFDEESQVHRLSLDKFSFMSLILYIKETENELCRKADYLNVVKKYFSFAFDTLGHLVKIKYESTASNTEQNQKSLNFKLHEILKNIDTIELRSTYTTFQEMFNKYYLRFMNPSDFENMMKEMVFKHSHYIVNYAVQLIQKKNYSL